MVVPVLAEATTVVPLDFRQLTDKASTILRGRVVSLNPQWASDRHGIDTIVTLQVSNYLKGDFGPLVTFRVPGGTIGRWRSVTAGAPVFREGEEVIVFLGAAGAAIPRVVGFNQGVYRVTVDQKTGTRLVTPPPLSEVSTPTPVVRGDASRKPMPVAQFEGRVRAMLQGTPGDSARDARDRVKDKKLR